MLSQAVVLVQWCSVRAAASPLAAAAWQPVKKLHRFCCCALQAKQPNVQASKPSKQCAQYLSADLLALKPVLKTKATYTSSQAAPLLLLMYLVKKLPLFRLIPKTCFPAQYVAWMSHGV